MSNDDKLISLAHKDIKFCLGCESCQNKLEKHCVLDDYITNNVYEEILNESSIIIVSPVYMSNINGITKNLLDRFNPFYNHGLLKDKKVYLILSGYASKEENKDEIDGIIKYFESMTGWLYNSFEFLDYFQVEDNNYLEKIDNIKQKLQ